jgi:3-deoxy-7-phosphoheptulonate synthase
MVIVLQKNIKDEEKAHIKEFLSNNNFKTNEIVGEETTIIAAVGKLKVDPREVEILPGVERVIPISKPYKMASREFKPENTVVEVPNKSGQIIRVGGQRIVAIAGPCAVETRDQMMAVAERVSQSGAVILRGGAYKPRTSPYSFQGLGEEGLKLLRETGDKFGMPVVTEVVASEFLPLMEKYGIDVYQVGARNMQNFELLKRLGKLGKPVILKRGIAATIEEWLMSAEYLLSSGTDDVILCERGIRTYERATRNTLDLSSIPVLRGMTHLPVIVDPSHAVGIRDKIPPMGLAAIAAGADGIIVEVHCNPDKALSDGAQSLYPEQFDKLMRDIEALAPVVGKSVTHLCSIQTPVFVAENEKQHGGIVCAFSGKRGAYAEQAVVRYFDKGAVPLAVDSFRDIFQAVIDGRADYGMVPIENTLAGSVYENYDNITQFEDVSIIGAIHLRIQHALLGIKGTSLDTIKSVFSHPQAFSQCSRFLASHPVWNKIDCISTATAASDVAGAMTLENAAIASSINATYYKLEVIQDLIEDDPANFTRFILIALNHFTGSSKVQELTEACRCAGGLNPNMASFVFSVKNEPGALYKCLGVFENYKLNLTRLESRPVAGQPWHYRFYADAELQGTDSESVKYVNSVMDALKKQADQVRLLGIYAEASRIS